MRLTRACLPAFGREEQRVITVRYCTEIRLFDRYCKNSQLRQLGYFVPGPYHPSASGVSTPIANFWLRACVQPTVLIGPPSWSSSYALVYGAGGLWFKSRAGQIGHKVTKGSPSLRRFFKRSSVPHSCSDAEMGLANSLHALA